MNAQPLAAALAAKVAKIERLYAENQADAHPSFVRLLAATTGANTMNYDPNAAWYGDDRGNEDAPVFADPGGTSALRAASKRNPRNLPCPSCHTPNTLTPADRAAGYQCDDCADRAERGW